VAMVRRTSLRWVLIGLLAAAGAAPGLAFDNLSKGKSVQQRFNSGCAICHRSTRGLGASMGARTLAGFLAEHYTTSKAEAAALAGYLAAAGKGSREPRPRPRRAKSPAKSKSN